MEFEITTTGAAPAGTAPAQAAPAKAETAPPTAKTEAAAAAPAPVVADKPARRAAKAKAVEAQAQTAATQAAQKTAEAERTAAQVAKYQEAIASGDADKIMAAFGITDERLVDMYIAKHGTQDEPAAGASKAEKDAAVAELKAELEKFKAELADEKTKAEAKRKDEEAQTAINNHVRALKELAGKPEHAERFEACNAAPEVIRTLTEGQYSSGAALAFDVMVEVFNARQKYISYEEALDLTEKHLVEVGQKAVERARGIKKLGGTTAAAAKPTEATETVAPSGDPALDKLRAAFKKARPRVTNGLAVSFPATTARPSGKAAADQRFKERLLAAARATGPAN